MIILHNREVRRYTRMAEAATAIRAGGTYLCGNPLIGMTASVSDQLANRLENIPFKGSVGVCNWVLRRGTEANLVGWSGTQITFGSATTIGLVPDDVFIAAIKSYYESATVS